MIYLLKTVEKVCFISRSGEPPARVLLILTVLTVKISPFLRFLKALGSFDLCGGRLRASRPENHRQLSYKKVAQRIFIMGFATSSKAEAHRFCLYRTIKNSFTF